MCHCQNAQENNHPGHCLAAQFHEATALAALPEELADAGDSVPGFSTDAQVAH